MKYRMTLSTRFEFAYLPPATKLQQGNVFTPVCDSVHGRGGPLSRGGAALSRGGGCLPGGVSVRETPPHRAVMCGQYASYWNALLLVKCTHSVVFVLQQKFSHQLSNW